MNTPQSRLPKLDRPKTISALGAQSSARKLVRRSIAERSKTICKNKPVAKATGYITAKQNENSGYSSSAIRATPSYRRPLAVANARATPVSSLKRPLTVSSVPRGFREVEQPSAEIENQLKELRDVCDQLRRKHSDALSENEQLKVKNSLMESEKHLKNIQFESVSNNLQAVTEKLTMATVEYKILKSENDATTQLYQSAMEQIKQLRNECEIANAQILNMQNTHKQELLSCNERIRHLLNEVVDLRGRIRVAVRIRPFLPDDGPSTSIAHFGFPDLQSINIKANNKSSSYQFQNVLGCNASQKKVFSDMEELVESVLHGYNVAIIAYGQTGSGKTFTMRGGSGEDAGIIPRAIEFMFNTKNKLSDLDWKYNYSASFLEVYNDEVFDLLAEQKSKLKVSVGSGQVEIVNLKCFELNSPDELHELLALSDKNRSTASTKMNSTSSRSHAVFFLRVTATNTMTNQSFSSVLSMVDLAGSERAKESEAEGARFTEMTYINKALSNLQNVIRALLKKEQHIPYRNSKLTLLLQECLGKGNSKTLMIVNLRPSSSHSAESKRSLDFAQNTSKTVIGAAVKSDAS